MEYKGKEYYFSDGVWVDSFGKLASRKAQESLYGKYLDAIDMSSGSFDELIEFGDIYKQINRHEKALELYLRAYDMESDITKIKGLFSRLSSCYRALNKPEDAISLYNLVKEKYGNKVISNPFKISVAYAYCDMKDYEMAKQLADWAFASSGGFSNAANVYERIRRETKNEST